MNTRHRTLLKEAIRGKGFCKGLGVGKRMYHAIFEIGRGGFDPLCKILTLITHSKNDMIVDYICAEQDGIFVRNTVANDSKFNIYQSQSRVISELSDVIQVLTKSCSDGKLTTREIEAIKVQVDEFNKEIYGVIKAAESGKYNS